MSYLAGWNIEGVTADKQDDWGAKFFENEQEARRFIWTEARLFATDLFLEEYEFDAKVAAENLSDRLNDVQRFYFGQTDSFYFSDFHYWIRREGF